MPKTHHEVRDAIHGFLSFNTLEKTLIDSAPFQRLRCIHQLAMCYQVYPGATHKRFEHSLGVMEVATRIFDSIFREPMEPSVRDRISEQLEPNQRGYWRQVVRLAALLHDVGHLPFSHAAEKELLPEGWNHERLTMEIIRHSEIAQILQDASPPIKPEDVIDVACDVADRIDGKNLTPWKTVLNEIITGRTFGADRIDYLLRDSWHAGVAYGRFDPDRLIAGLRLMIDPEIEEIALGIERASIHSAEALLLARYFMYSQVYFHKTRRIYDIHLKDFLQAWLPNGRFSTDWKELLKVADDEILSQLRRSAADPSEKLYDLAIRLVKRQHFRTAFELVSTQKKERPAILSDVTLWAQEKFGQGNVRCDSYGPKSENNDFLVWTNGVISSSIEASGVIANIPPFEIGYVFVDQVRVTNAKSRIKTYTDSLLQEPKRVIQ